MTVPMSWEDVDTIYLAVKEDGRYWRDEWDLPAMRKPDWAKWTDKFTCFWITKERAEMKCNLLGEKWAVEEKSKFSLPDNERPGICMDWMYFDELKEIN